LAGATQVPVFAPSVVKQVAPAVQSTTLPPPTPQEWPAFANLAGSHTRFIGSQTSPSKASQKPDSICSYAHRSPAFKGPRHSPSFVNEEPAQNNVGSQGCAPSHF
jgi:hypothetical protein